MKFFVPKRKNVTLIALMVLGLALIAIGYSGVVNDLLAKRTTASITEVGPQDNQGEYLVDIPVDDIIDDPLEVDNPVVETQQSGQKSAEGQKSDGFFIEYRIERERTRGQQVEWLREIINNPNSDNDTRKVAQEQLYTISQNMGKEMEIESLIRAKGFSDAVVLIQHLPDKVVTVVVKSENLTTEQAAQIADLVSRNTGVAKPNIVIIPKN